MRREYEKTAYDIRCTRRRRQPTHRSLCHREAEASTPATRARERKCPRSLKFAGTLRCGSGGGLGAAADDLYEMKDYERTIVTAHKLIEQFPKAEQDIRRAAWLVAAHSSFALEKFEDAEKGYVTVVQLTAETDKTREAVIDNLAASIYKQGEQARKRRMVAAIISVIATVAPTEDTPPPARDALPRS
jgi:hypothetical protein